MKQFQENIYDLFLKQVQETPNSNAITMNADTITYSELEQKVKHFSNRLSQFKFELSEPVAIALPPSIDFVVAMLACFKLNVTYLPLDLQNPDIYLNKILNDAKVNFLITNTSQTTRFTSFNMFFIINIEKTEDKRIKKILQESKKENDVLYIIYTSGTTGDPKGVILKKYGLINLIESTRHIYKINSNDRVTLIHSVSFDVSIWEICATLLNGAHLFIPDAFLKHSPEDYLDFLIKNEISIINMTPSYFYLFNTTILNTPSESLLNIRIRLVLLAGEAFYPKKIRTWFNHEISKRIAIYNMYGITEGTIHSTYLAITPNMIEDNISLIGEPIPGVDLVIIDSDGELVTNDTIGEICLGGISISSGYLGQPELTRKKFIDATFNSDKAGRWFLTGDLAKRTEKGLEYIGRKDKLIKIRGYRINSIDIENILCSYDGVQDAIVDTFVAADEQQRLIAFVKAEQGISESLITSQLKRDLPKFMLPSKLVLIDSFLFTINGKMDVSQLMNKYVCSNFEYETCKLSLLDKVIIAWKSVLNTSEIDIHTNFFDLGGDSLLLVKLQYTLETMLDIKVKVLDLMRYSTIEKFINFLRMSSPDFSKNNEIRLNAVPD